MKKLFVCFVVGMLCITQSLNAQVDLKVNPLGLILGRATAGVEFAVASNVGIEATASQNFYNLTYNEGDENEVKFKSRTYRIMLNGRYYFNPQKGADRFYLGVYGRHTGGKLLSTEANSNNNEAVTQNRYAVGMLMGAKIVARNQRLIFDFNIGVGRTLVNEYQANGSGVNVSDIPLLKIDVPVAVSVGYRFGGGNKKK